MLNVDGNSDFEALHSRKYDHEVQYYAFDMLAGDGDDYRRLGLMKRYYFDLIDGDEIFPDEEGLELSIIEKVQEEAARSLADMARDAVRSRGSGHSHQIAIEDRDEIGPVLHLKVTFELDRRRQ